MLARLLLAVALLYVPLAQTPAQKPGERAVFVYPRERSLFRRIFYTAHQNELLARAARRYRVERYAQIATADELFAIDVRDAKLLVISGHGDPFSMHLSSSDVRTLDATTHARLAAFFDMLAPDATIVLQSCFTGRGFAHVVKEAAGPTRRVIAARGEVPWDGLEITSLAPFDATMHCDDGGRRWDCTLRLR
jgi:hypothetical protein